MIQLDDLLAAGGALAHPGATAWDEFCYDSRLAAPGQLFLAIRTERRDGHQFIADAVRGGCTGILCERPPAAPVDATVVVVPDVLAAVQRWAAAQLRRVHPVVIGITGSVGKTSTKRAIAAVLAGLGPTFASRRSFNSLFGLPIALDRLEPHHRFAVLEMGVDRFGEMRRLVELFPPDIAVVTNVGPTHLRFLRDEEHIAAEKGDLVRALRPGGCAVLNGDDARVAAMARPDVDVLRFGLDAPDLDLRARSIVPALDGTAFEVEYQGQRLPAHVPLLGAHSVMIALAAVAVALRCGMAFADAVARLPQIARQAGRLQPLPAIMGATLLDDTYNASPASTHAALDALAALPARRRIAVLGDMLELGDAAPRLHQEVGAHAARVADLVVAKGDLAAAMIAPEQLRAGRAIVTHTAADAVAAVRAALEPGDLVLVKGSAEARMEQIVAGLLPPTVDPTAVLVRQERAFETVRVADAGRPTWIEVDLGAIRGNYRALQRIVGPAVRVMPTLKADAYGHGAVRVARTLDQAGAWGFALATLGEAAALRDASIAAPLLILGYTPAWQVRDAIRRRVRLTVFDPEVAREISAAAQELALPAIVHLKVDTGMGRLGLPPAEALELLRLLHALPGVEVEGMFTHFATADSADERFAREQLARFQRFVDSATSAGLRPPSVHAANSAGILRLPEAHYDLVRPGIAIYGLAPAPETPLPAGFKPALGFKTEVAQVKTVPTGTPIGYGGTFVAARTTRIATIPVGYADGFRRTPGWRAVLLHGRRVLIVGRVAMDYAMLDVTELDDVRVGDEVVLIGAQGDDRITADEVAGWLGTINYEVVAAILPRVPRTV